MKRKLTYIESDRKLIKSKSFDLVYEWEDILSKKLNIKMKCYSRIQELYHGRFEKNGLVNLYQNLHRESDIGLHFVMRARIKPRCFLNCNKIPVIIDFWLTEHDLKAFYETYKNVPLLLVTNLEVYEFLKFHKCPIPVEHWPLSFPDKYIPIGDKDYNKKYDFTILGRPNPFFLRLLEEYAIKHPNFVYIINNGRINAREYLTNKGEFVAYDIGRESYLQMIKNTKVTCYTTPGLDEAKEETTIFNQVTPRLFEMLANGCHVIGHYPLSADTLYYNLSEIIPNVNNYVEFEKVLDHFLTAKFDEERAKRFLKKHTTSTRADMLRDLLRKYNITV